MISNISNVTVNGRPVGEYIAKTQPRKGRNRAFTNGLSAPKSSRGEVIYEAGQKAQKVRILGQVFAWKDKAPFKKSGASVLGAVELTADESEAKCHECGNWFEAIAMHIRAHRVSSRKYRIKHGLNLRSSLNSSTRIKARRKQFTSHAPKNLGSGRSAEQRKSAARQGAQAMLQVFAARRLVTNSVNPELYNLRMKCEAQRIKDLKAFAKELGRTPTCDDMNRYTNNAGEHPFEYHAMVDFFGVPMKAIMLRAGLVPRNAGGGE